MTERRGNSVIKTIVLLVIVFVLAVGGGFAGSFIGYKLFGTTGGDIATIKVSDGKVSGTSADASTIAEKMTSSVVAITTESMTTDNFWYGEQVVSGAGSGVIIDANGYILTCAHVVSGANKIKVLTHDGKTYDAEIIGSSVENDIAVIKIDAQGLTPVTFADTDNLVQGQTVYAVGNPEGVLSDSITSGIISALNRSITVKVEDSESSNDNYFWPKGYKKSGKTITLTVIQTDAAVSPGNSGGGLFNANGDLIGIVSAKSTESGSEGLGFAIYGNTARELAEEMIKNAQSN